MKIVILHNLYGEFSHGGAETAVAMMADNYQKQGYEVFLISTRPLQRKPQTDNKLKIYHLASEFYNLSQHSLPYRLLWQIANLFSFAKYYKIKKILEQEKPDLAITHNLMGLGLLSVRAIHNLKIRHEHFLHDIQLLHPSGLMIWGQEKKIASPAARLYQYYSKNIIGSPQQVISPSRWLLDMHSDNGFFKNSELLFKPFTWPQSANAITTKNKPAKNFLFIGQIEEQKGILFLINSFKKIPGANLTLNVAIRDGGQDLATARQLAADDLRIKFLGPLSYEETDKIKELNDCLIVPSLCYENSPTVIYGAQAAGLKIVAAKLGGIPELMKPGDELFQPGDAQDLIRVISKLI